MNFTFLKSFSIFTLQNYYYYLKLPNFIYKKLLNEFYLYFQMESLYFFNLPRQQEATCP